MTPWPSEVPASSPERGARLRQLGATHVLSRIGGGDETAPKGYDVIVDIVAGADLASFFSRLNANGRLVSVGAVGGFPPPDFAGGLFGLFQKSLTFSTFSGNTVAESVRRAMTAKLFALAAHGEVQTVRDEVLPLEQAESAHQRMQQGGAFGKLILAPSRRG